MSGTPDPWNSSDQSLSALASPDMQAPFVTDLGLATGPTAPHAQEVGAPLPGTAQGAPRSSAAAPPPGTAQGALRSTLITSGLQEGPALLHTGGSDTGLSPLEHSAASSPRAPALQRNRAIYRPRTPSTMSDASTPGGSRASVRSQNALRHGSSGSAHSSSERGESPRSQSGPLGAVGLGIENAPAPDAAPEPASDTRRALSAALREPHVPAPHADMPPRSAPPRLPRTLSSSALPLSSARPRHSSVGVDGAPAVDNAARRTSQGSQNGADAVSMYGVDPTESVTAAVLGSAVLRGGDGDVGVEPTRTWAREGDGAARERAVRESPREASTVSTLSGRPRPLSSPLVPSPTMRGEALPLSPSVREQMPRRADRQSDSSDGAAEEVRFANAARVVSSPRLHRADRGVGGGAEGPPAGDVRDVDALIVEDVRDAAAPSVGDVRDAAAPSVGDVRDADATFVGDARGANTPFVGDVRGADAPSVADVRDAAAPSVSDVRDADTPSVGDVRDADAPSVGDVRDADATFVGDVRDADATFVGDVRDADAPIAVLSPKRAAGSADAPPLPRAAAAQIPPPASPRAQPATATVPQGFPRFPEVPRRKSADALLATDSPPSTYSTDSSVYGDETDGSVLIGVSPRAAGGADAHAASPRAAGDAAGYGASPRAGTPPADGARRASPADDTRALTESQDILPSSTESDAPSTVGSPMQDLSETFASALADLGLEDFPPPPVSGVGNVSVAYRDPHWGLPASASTLASLLPPAGVAGGASGAAASPGASVAARSPAGAPSATPPTPDASGWPRTSAPPLRPPTSPETPKIDVYGQNVWWPNSFDFRANVNWDSVSPLHRTRLFAEAANDLLARRHDLPVWLSLAQAQTRDMDAYFAMLQGAQAERNKAADTPLLDAGDTSTLSAGTVHTELGLPPNLPYPAIARMHAENPPPSPLQASTSTATLSAAVRDGINLLTPRRDSSARSAMGGWQRLQGAVPRVQSSTSSFMGTLTRRNSRKMRDAPRPPLSAGVAAAGAPPPTPFSVGSPSVARLQHRGSAYGGAEPARGVLHADAGEQGRAKVAPPVGLGLGTGDADALRPAPPLNMALHSAPVGGVGPPPTGALARMLDALPHADERAARAYLTRSNGDEVVAIGEYMRDQAASRDDTQQRRTLFQRAPRTR
ncbi:hypothetical protein MSPP1_001226 [Malassezia sp. CBS 17886]|nr:hypothetical protein MSPP1_001226 [Malassezia sp. CBS 17886]